MGLTSLQQATKMIDEINQQTPDQPKCRVVGLLKHGVVTLYDGAEEKIKLSFKTLRRWHHFATKED